MIVKAILTKNNDFDTIGFKVIVNNQTTVFDWGSTGTSTSVWRKEVDVNKWATEIFTLIKLSGELEECEEFTSCFFETLRENERLGCYEGWKMKNADDRKARLKTRIINIIEKIT